MNTWVPLKMHLPRGSVNVGESRRARIELKHLSCLELMTMVQRLINYIQNDEGAIDQCGVKVTAGGEMKVGDWGGVGSGNISVFLVFREAGDQIKNTPVTYVSEK